jgi:hypothetical protein
MKAIEYRVVHVLVIMVFVSVLICGCEGMWVKANRDFLERDMRMLLDEKCYVRPTQIDCRMLGTSRDAIATFALTGEQAAAVIKGLALKEAIEGSEEEAFLEKVLSSSHHKDLEELRGFLNEGVKRYCSRRRAKELILGNGVSFEYFVLYFDPATEHACILLSYAYG